MDLSRKYAGVVKRLQRNVAHDLAVFRLGLWGLNVTASGLALVRGNQISTRNARRSAPSGTSAARETARSSRFAWSGPPPIAASCW